MVETGDAGPPREALQAAFLRERRIADALREVGNALGTTLELDDLLELILSKVTDLLEADRATLYLLDDAHDELVSRIVVGQDVRSIRLKVGHGIAGTVAQTGKTVRIRDAYLEPTFERQWDALTGYRTTSVLTSPLKNHLGRTIGVIQVLNKKRAEEFTSEDEALVMALSTQAAVAIDNSRLFLSLIQKNKQLLETTEQLARKLKDLELLFELERATARATDLENLLLRVMSLVADACSAQGAATQLVEEESGDQILYIYDAASPEGLIRRGIKAGDGVLSEAMDGDAPVLFEDAVNHPRYSAAVEGAFPFQFSTILAMGLEGNARSMGALGLYKDHEPRFSDEDVSLLRLVAANAATAVRLHRASRAREVSERLTTIGRLLSQVIHDFKTPMTVISGYVQLMVDADANEKRTEYAEEVLKQFDTLSAMQREVLEFARGERSIFIRKVYLKKFFAEVTRQLAHEVDGRAVELEVEVDTKIVARFDEARLARAIFNLARNAVEAMAERGGALILRAKMDGGDLVISVSDTGPGIPESIATSLFQSFVTANKQGGTGLGLAIVKKIVDEHGGTVDVTSSSSGATFTLRLPQSAPTQGEPEQASPPKGKRRRGDVEKNTG
ncbi:MAG: GAF domain-containing protein [Polyangiaceae bacterium]